LGDIYKIPIDKGAARDLVDKKDLEIIILYT